MFALIELSVCITNFNQWLRSTVVAPEVRSATPAAVHCSQVLLHRGDLGGRSAMSYSTFNS
ncbi:hypothetical protein AS25_11405 [Kocuria marina]|uniref:Uncharacterized protein n=1 Tax=Kocuria marina TaxID=223184 RepID=A0A0B0DBY2_9MICC|nr:hypothetical protein AS25_11405 [Kocuria marina]